MAAQGKLHDPAVLEHQVRRMLADPRADSLVSNFADQWLYLRNLRGVAPDLETFPNFDDNLRQAFKTRDRAVLRQHHPRRPQRARSAERRLHLRQ